MKENLRSHRPSAATEPQTAGQLRETEKMKLTINATLALIAMTLLMILAAAAIFTPQAKAFDFELPCHLQAGDACKGAPGADGADGAPGLDGVDGADGIDGKDGLNGADADPSGLAVAMALSTPNWLEANESIAFAGGWGHFDGRHAIAGTGILRLDDAWAVTGGIAADTRFDVWGARAGLRAGW